jgi:hypothetical protein
MTTHMKKGKKAKHSDVKMDKAMVKKAVHKHERNMHPGKKITKLSGGGLGRMNMERKAVGRNMAKVMAQRGR